MKLWSATGNTDTVREYVLLPRRQIATIEDYTSMSALVRSRHRSEQEPVTLDFTADDAPHVYEEAQKAILEANSLFRFNITKWQQPLRFNTYSPGQKFNWHHDYTMEDNSKLAFIHVIQEAEEGGDVRLMVERQVKELKLSAGTTVVFPAYIEHCITEVVRGTRVALVGWATGRQFV